MGPQGNRPQPRWWPACLCDVQENASVVYRRILLPGKDREGSSLLGPFFPGWKAGPASILTFLAKCPCVPLISIWHHCGRQVHWTYWCFQPPFFFIKGKHEPSFIHSVRTLHLQWGCSETLHGKVYSAWPCEGMLRVSEILISNTNWFNLHIKS